MPDASPVKWHLAHTTWFFETFVLTEFVEGYRPFDGGFAALFNSYYESKGPRIARGARGLLTRPSLEEVHAYRCYVDSALEIAIDRLPLWGQGLVELGYHHEQQHQELLLTNLLHLFAQNPLAPAAWAPLEESSAHRLADIEWIPGKHGAVQIGNDGAAFGFDCERPRHTVWLSPHALADRLVTNLEWQAFIDADGYRRPEFWLADGWAIVR